MSDLWKVIAELAASLHTDRIALIADAIGDLKGVEKFESAKSAFGPNANQTQIEQLQSCWAAQPMITASEISAAFRSAAEVAKSMSNTGTTELVWTGPRTGVIPARRTEQVILEVIDSAQYDIFLVTYVFYAVSSVVDSLNVAVGRGVTVNILLESSVEHGGAIRGDNVKAIAERIAEANIYIWDCIAKQRSGEGLPAAVHAKCAVADGRLAFVTSANVTSAALERNMELGVLVRGGAVPARLRSHLEALAARKIIKKWEDS